MEMTELKGLLETQAKTFEAFKAANDARLAQLERGAEDAVTVDQVKKINAALDEIGGAIKQAASRQDDIEKRLNRPGAGEPSNDAERKACDTFNRQLVAAASERGRPQPAALDLDGFRAYKRLFFDYCRGGAGDGWSDAERKAMSVGTDPDGGYLAPADMAGRIVGKLYDMSPIRAIASVQTTSRSSLEGAIDKDDVGSGWTSEKGARPETTTPQVGKWSILAEEMYAAPQVTQTLLDDAAVDVEAWLVGKIADKFARTEAAAFVNGTGVGQPRGFLKYATAATADASRAWGTLEHVGTGSSGAWGTAPNGSDKLIALVHAIKAGYRNGAVFVANKKTFGDVRTLKANNEYIWLPTMDAGRPASLLGYPTVEAEDMPDVAASSLSIAFGNFAIGYQIVDRTGLRVLRDPYTAKPYVIFYATKRVGGDVLNFEAIKLLRFA